MSAKLVLQTDFGLVDGAVAAMYGVAYSVDETLSIHDLTHEIPPFDIFAAAPPAFTPVPCEAGLSNIVDRDRKSVV